jgi:hypothetical protein
VAGVRIGIQGAAPSFHRGGGGGVNRTETEFSSRCRRGVRLDTDTHKQNNATGKR